MRETCVKLAMHDVQISTKKKLLQKRNEDAKSCRPVRIPMLPNWVPATGITRSVKNAICAC